MATTAQDGSVFQAGGPVGSAKAAAATGRWVAAITRGLLRGQVGGERLVEQGRVDGELYRRLAARPVGYWRWTRAVLRTLSLELASTSPRRLAFVGGEGGDEDQADDVRRVVAALVMTAPP